ncbi:hypothetical protein Hypma_007142, partial [Hypsizygus marmoreus]
MIEDEPVEDIHELRKDFLHSHGPLRGLLTPKPRTPLPPPALSSLGRSSSMSSYKTTRSQCGPNIDRRGHNERRTDTPSRPPALATRLSDNTPTRNHPPLAARLSGTSSLNSEGVPSLLRTGVLYLPAKETQVRAKLWHIVKGPFASVEDLLLWLIEYGLEFCIAVPESKLPRWTPNPIMEADQTAEKFYNSPQTDLVLTWNRGEEGFMEDYECGIANVLLRPHAWLVVFEGGPLHWIVRRYHGEELISEVMKGPSIQVTVHHSGYLNTQDPRMLRADMLSSTEKNALYGLLAQGKPDMDKTLWPTDAILRDCLDGYTGQWTAECEGLFHSIWAKISAGQCTLCTCSKWNQYIRTSNRLGTANVAPSYIEWDKAWWRILRGYPEIWSDIDLSSLNLKEHFLSH